MTSHLHRPGLVRLVPDRCHTTGAETRPEYFKPMADRTRGNGRTPGGGARAPLWAYGYELAPPVARRRLKGMQTILDEGHAEARSRAQVWEGRFVNGAFITHILVVSGTRTRDNPVTRRLEAELARLEAGYSVTTPVEVAHDPRRRPDWGGAPPDADS